MELKNEFVKSISTAEKIVLKNLDIYLENTHLFLPENTLHEELNNINKKISVEYNEFFSYKNKKTAFQCAEKKCETFLSPKNKSNYCKIHQQRFMDEVYMFGRDLEYLTKINIDNYKPSSELNFILNFFFKKLDQLETDNYEIWNKIKIITLTLRRYPNINYSLRNETILEEFSSYSNIPKTKVIDEVNGLVAFFEGILIFVQSYFANVYFRNLEDTAFKKIRPVGQNVKSNIIYGSKLTTDFWSEFETIKNNCKFNNYTGCKSSKGKLKKIFKTKELAFLYARKNQYVYLCDKHSLGFHIATKKNYFR
tara:strand:- start:75 stop:1001 length:927 start_codon:yes stop_codon:yes gene_type:complete